MRGEDIIIRVKPSNTARNTSTCVEKTSTIRRDLILDQKHLHVRGEDSEGNLSRSENSETPPRAWRRPPTNAELENGEKKHLHVRGEDIYSTRH